MTTKKKTRTNGDARLTCRNHPQMRWTKTKYTLPGEIREFIGDGRLMFDGEVQPDGSLKAGYPLGTLTESGLREKIKASCHKKYREQYAIQCDCPYNDLEFLEWCD